MWSIDRELVLHSINILATQAILAQQATDIENQRPYNERQQVDKIEAKIATHVRQNFWDAKITTADTYQTLNLNGWFEVRANEIILDILRQEPNDDAAMVAFEKLAKTLVNWWNADKRRDQHEQRDYEAEARLTRLLENFLLRTTGTKAITITRLIVEAINSHPDKVESVLSGLISVEDSQPNTAQFWVVWEEFARGVKQASWLSDLDDEHSRGSEMISFIFLGYWWREDARHWRSLEGYAERLDRLFEDLPATSIVLDKYTGFLYRIGERSLPKAFIYIANRLQQGNPQQMLRKSNTVYRLEALLQRYVYGKPLELKMQDSLREAVLFLLDILVDNGSSAAFKMRDDFVTPISAR